MTQSQHEEIIRLADWCRNEAVDFYMGGEPAFAAQLIGVAERIEEIFPE